MLYLGFYVFSLEVVLGSGFWWIFITNSASFVFSLGSTSNENPYI